jgi:pyridoxal phosphate enzyme (YggS family)
MRAITHSVEDLRARFEDVSARVTRAAIATRREPSQITLVGISKTHPASMLQDALQVGITDLGENRVQEAEAKIAELGRQAARWHLVGHLQPNKARKAVRLFDIVHSLDSTSLAHRLERMCEEENVEHLSMLIQVDLGREATKSGIPESGLAEMVQAFDHLTRLKLIGLMTLPPFFENPEDARPFFRRLRELRDELESKGSFGEHKGELSMGMSHDFEVAIEEGATMLRIGTAIFGERSMAE